jgi:hypothetical protein
MESLDQNTPAMTGESTIVDTLATETVMEPSQRPAYTAKKSHSLLNALEERANALPIPSSEEIDMLESMYDGVVDVAMLTSDSSLKVKFLLAEANISPYVKLVKRRGLEKWRAVSLARAAFTELHKIVFPPSESAPLMDADLEDFLTGEQLLQAEDPIFTPSSVEDVVPQYDASLSLLQMEESIRKEAFEKKVELNEHDRIVRTLQMRNYPAHIVVSLARQLVFGNPRFRQLRVMTNRAARPVKLDNSSASASAKAKHFVSTVTKWRGGQQPLHWRVPVTKGAPVFRKPLARELLVDGHFQSHLFRRWFNGAVFALYQLRRGEEFVTASDVFHSLWKGQWAGTVHALDTVLQGGPRLVYLQSEYKQMTNHTYSIRLITDLRSLPVFGRDISDASELASMKTLFKRHGPIHRLGVRYLSGQHFELAEINKLYFFFVEHFSDDTNPPSITEPVENFVFTDGKESLSGAVLQGQVISAMSNTTPLHVEHTVNFPGLEQLLGDLRDLFSTHGDESFTRSFAKIASFLVSLSQTGSYLGAVSTCVQFISSFDYLWNAVGSALQAIQNPTLVLQGGLLDKPLTEVRSWPGFYDFWTAIVSGIVSTIMEAFSGVDEVIRNSLYHMVRESRDFIFRESGKALGASLIAGAREIFTRIKRCIETCSLTPLWGTLWDPQRWARDVELMMTHYPVLTGLETDALSPEMKEMRLSGRVPSWWSMPVTKAEFIEKCEIYIQQADIFKSHFASSPLVVSDLLKIRVKLRAFTDNIIAQRTMTTSRPVPYMVAFQGVAGGGKSNLATLIASAIAAKHGFDPTGVYPWQTDVNFQDGLDHTQWCVAMDDVDQGVAKDSAGVRNHVQNVIALVNNVPFPVEAAAVELKGRIRACPRLVTYTTNFKNFNLTGHTLQPHAFYRRIGILVHVSAKSEFSLGNGVLDKLKAAAADTHDLFDLTISYYDPNLTHNTKSGDKWKLPFTPPVSITFGELMVLVQTQFAAHLRFEMNRLNTTNDSALCPVCFVPKNKKCGHELQGKQSLLMLGAAMFLIGRQTLTWRPKWTLFDDDKIQTLVVRLKKNLTFFQSDVITQLATYGLAIGATSVALGLVAHYVLQGRENNTTSAFVPPTWMRADQTFIPGIPPSGLGSTFTKDDLDKALAQSCVKVMGHQGGHGLVVGQNLLIFPSHFVSSNGTSIDVDNCIVTITHGDRSVKVRVTGLNCTLMPSNPHICMFRTGELKGLPSISAKIWAHDDNTIQSYDAMELWGAGLCQYKPSTNQRLVASHGEIVWSTSAPTEMGDCGMVYVAQFGKTWRIVAMHYMQLTVPGAEQSIGAIITRQELTKMAVKLNATLQGVETPLKALSKVPGTQLQFTRFPPRSEVWVAMTEGAQLYPFGEIHPPIGGSTDRTALQRSLIADDFTDLIDKWCGKSHYWAFPDFRGKMGKSGQWESPYTEAFKTQPTQAFDTTLMWVAMADYLSGMDELDRSGYTTISEQEVVNGIPGSYIRGANLRTSVGPPYFQSKRYHVSRNDDGVFFSPEICELYDVYRDCLDSGEVPAPVGACTLKDEAVKLRDDGTYKKPRVFTNYSAAYNFLGKEHFAAIQSFIRAHLTFFESAVGLDATSHDIMRVVNHLRTVDTTLTNLLDGDVKALDKSYTGEVFEFISLVMYAISWVLGLQAFKARNLVLGLKHTRFVIKGDLFSVWWNGSGNFITVEINCIFMSLMHRYYYYLKRPALVALVKPFLKSFMEDFINNPIPCLDMSKYLTFRLHNALVTYGDDVLRALDYSEDEDFPQLIYEHFGLIITDANKGMILKRKRIEEAEFLKRRFVWSEEFQRYITPLSKKSLARMLQVKFDSMISSRDHAAVNMTNVMRELVYHGRDEYDSFRIRADSVALKHELLLHPLYVSRPYEYWAEKLNNKTFNTFEHVNTNNQTAVQ